MHTPATTHPQDRHTQWTTAPASMLGEPTPPAHPAPASAADPAPAPAPAPARSWTPDSPARHTDRTPTTTAAAADSTAAPTAAAAVVVNAQARQPRQPRPRQHTPTPATPASIAASPNPDRHGARPGNTTAKTRHRTVAAACSPTQTNLAPAANSWQIAASSSLPVAAQPKTGPAPASDLGQSLASSSLPPAARPKPARSRPATLGDHSPLRRCRLQPDRRPPGPGLQPRPTSHLFVADRLSPNSNGAPTRQGHGNTTPLDARAGLGRGPSQHTPRCSACGSTEAWSSPYARQA